MNKYVRLSVFLVLFFVLLITLTATAVAYTTYGTIGDITLNGTTYYDLYNNANPRPDLTVQQQFLQDVVQNRDNYANWLVLAPEVLKQLEDSDRYLGNMATSCASGLTYTNTLQNVDYEARGLAVSDSKIGRSHVSGIADWKDNDTVQPIFYAQRYDRYRESSGGFIYQYYVRGIVFYDFQVALLADPSLQYDTAADDYDSIEAAAHDGASGVTYESIGSADGLVGGVTNYSAEPVTASQELSDHSTLALSNSIQKSEQYTYTEMVGLETTFKASIPLFGGMDEKLTVQFTAQQAFSTAYTTQTSVEKGRDQTYNVQVVLPAHTTIIMKQNDTQTKATLSYDAPVVIKYKVAMYCLHGRYYDDDGLVQDFYWGHSYLSTFGKSDVDNAFAVTNLSNRLEYYASIPGYETTYGDGLNWDTLYVNGTSTVKDAVDWLKSHMPMSVTGAAMSADYKSVGSEIYALQPLYPLRRVASSTDELKMSPGDYLYVANLPVQGYNVYNVPYYGFDSRYGHWTLLDSAGTPIAGDANSTAGLVTDPVSGKTRLLAGYAPGTVYLKYVIAEDKYACSSNPTTFATNASLLGTALIKVDVGAAPFDGSVILTGSVTGYVNDPPLNLDGLSTVNVVLYDATGKEVVRPVVWEAQEASWRGITVLDNQLNLTNTGTFHVRARCGDKYSSWIEVTSLPARQLHALTISDQTDPATLAQWDLKNGHALIDLSKLTVAAVDQYGSPWTDLSALQWSCAPASGVTLTGPGGCSLDASQTGIYSIRAAIGSVQSNGLQLTVVDTTPPAEPSDPNAQLQAGPSVLLSFTDNATNETSFVVQRQDNGGDWTQIGTLGAHTGTGSVSFTDTSVQPGHTYTYRVASAVNSIFSSWSATASAGVPAAPAAPSSMTATVQSTTSVALSFVDNSNDETGFVIQRNDNGAGWVELHTLGSSVGTTVTYTDSTVVAGHTYQYRAAAVNGFVRSPWSNTATATTVSPPSAPTLLTASVRSGPQVLLSWRDNATNETGFAVERADDGGPFVQIMTRPARTITGSVTYSDTTVLAGHSYAYRVAAMRSGVLSGYSNTASAVIPMPPAAPSNVTVSANRGLRNDSVTIRWTRNSTDNTGFTIQRATNSSFTAGLTSYAVGATTTSYSQTTGRGVTYYYRVAATSSAGSSAWVNATPFPLITP
jgi:hypothetical protein